MLTNQNKALQAQLGEMKRKQAESDCKVRTERRVKRRCGLEDEPVLGGRGGSAEKDRGDGQM